MAQCEGKLIILISQLTASLMQTTKRRDKQILIKLLLLLPPILSSLHWLATGSGFLTHCICHPAVITVFKRCQIEGNPADKLRNGKWSLMPINISSTRGAAKALLSLKQWILSLMCLLQLLCFAVEICKCVTEAIV